MTGSTYFGFTYQGVLAIVNAIIALLVGINFFPDPKVAALVLAVVNTVLLALFHVQTLALKLAAAKRPATKA